MAITIDIVVDIDWIQILFGFERAKRNILGIKRFGRNIRQSAIIGLFFIDGNLNFKTYEAILRN